MSTKLVAEFFSRVQRSGLIPKDRLSELRQALAERGISEDDPKAIAEALVEQEALTRWQADKLLQGKHKGFFLGSYRLLRPLGKGGMGAVFLAEHEMMRRRCAIKILPHSQIKAGSSVLKRFYVEAQAVAALDHVNIVRAYDVNKEAKDGKDIHYLVMEYVEGRDIQAMVEEQGPLDCVQAADYLRQTANGLAHAHEANLVHRDIKPANLLVDKRGVVKILDLGLARFFDDSGQASLTTTHNETVLGTADYLSPEQALNSHDVDHRTDIYSLGCTAYFMLTGHPPFPEGTVAQRLVAHQVKEPEPIIAERPDADPKLVAIIEKMMAKKAKDRPQSATELSQLLAAWLLKYGGEDWRRQHSEVTGESGLLGLLKSTEPTRAMSSPMSETDLELAPLDDERHDDAGQDRSAPKPPKERRKPKPRQEEPAPVLTPESGEPEALPEPERLPELEPLNSLDRPADDNLFGDLAEPADLGSLDEPATVAALDEQALLDSVPLDDPLAHVDESVGASSSGSLSVLDSAVTRLPGQSGSVSSSSHRRLAAEQAKSGLKSVGLPIIIGVGGGLILVAVLFLLVFRPESNSNPNIASVDGGTSVSNQGNHAEDAQAGADNGEPNNATSEESQKAGKTNDKKRDGKRGGNRGGKKNHERSAAVQTGNGPNEQRQEGEVPASSHDQTPSQVTTGAPSPGDQASGDSGQEPGGHSAAANGADTRPAATAEDGTGRQNTPDGQPTPPAGSPSGEQSASGPEEAAVPPPPQELTQEEKDSLLAGIQQIQLDLDFPSQDERFPSAILRFMVETAQNLGWKRVPEAPAKMQVVVSTQKQGDYARLEMSMKIVYQLETEQQVVLYATDEPVELARFLPRGRLNPLQMNSMLSMVRKEAGVFFARFQRQYAKH